LTNRLLFEAAIGDETRDYTFDPEDHLFVNLINVTEQLGQIPGISYRGGGIGGAGQPYLDTDGLTWNTIGTMSYVTGSHSVKVGFGNLWNRRFNHWEPRRAQPQELGADYVAYRFANGLPQSAHTARHAVRATCEAAVGSRHLRAGRVDPCAG
jgi:hypothetical protein